MYYEKIAAAVIACAFVAMVSDTVSGASRSWTAEARERVQHTFSKDATFDASVVTGSIEVIGDDGSTIRVDGERLVRAESNEDLERAKREVILDIGEKDGVARLHEERPFHHSWGDNTYEVTYTLTIYVPRATELRLGIVNGSLQAERTTGKFDVHSVNGAVTLVSVAGSGEAHTVNGKLVVSFAENPKAASEFHTVNGRIEATMAPNLAADVQISTLNGAAFTDFDDTALTPAARHHGPGHSAHLRIGGGGPELSFNTVNGSVSIRKGVSQGASK